jgi:YHS domain-containing protein
MGRILLTFLLAVLLVALFACSGEKKTETKTGEMPPAQTTVADTGKAICPGCGMEMARNEMIPYVVEGKTLYFCSEQCKENYLATLEEKTETP